MAYRRQNNPDANVTAEWTGASAFDINLALKESQKWIQDVTGETFSSRDFGQSTKDGKLLCKLLNQIKPNSVRKINRGRVPFAHRENLQFFINGCRDLGLKDTQLFTSNDLYEGKRLRNVAITLYWLGRAARAVPSYKGPQLDVAKFSTMTCNRCKKPIKPDQDYVCSLDKAYHTRCARCDNCGCDLEKAGKAYAVGPAFYCPPCFEGGKTGGNNRLGQGKGGSNPRGGSCGKGNCGSCKKPIRGESTNSGGKPVCRDCLCDVCLKPFAPPNNFTNKGGKKVCPDCLCTSCGKTLDDGVVPTSSGNKCPACADKERKDRAHMTCHHPGCNKKLDNRTTPFDDPNRFCPEHYNEHVCPICGDELSGTIAEAMGNRYHPDCFRCSSCNGPFPNNKFYKIDDYPVCYDCMRKNREKGQYPTCPICDDSVKGQGIEACDNTYHPKCFNCTECGTNLANKPFVDIMNKPFCPPCAKSLGYTGPDPGAASGGPPRGEKCAACFKVLNQGDKVTNVGNKWFHHGCFKCQGCNCALTTGYNPIDDMPYCKKCYADRTNKDVCKVCGKKVASGGVKLRDWIFHNECCNCQYCGKNLKQMGGKVYVSNDMPSCESCAQKNLTQTQTSTRQGPSTITETIHAPRKSGLVYNPWTKKTTHKGAHGEDIPEARILKACPKCRRAVGDHDTKCRHCGYSW